MLQQIARLAFGASLWGAFGGVALLSIAYGVLSLFTNGITDDFGDLFQWVGFVMILGSFVALVTIPALFLVNVMVAYFIVNHARKNNVELRYTSRQVVLMCVGSAIASICLGYFYILSR